MAIFGHGYGMRSSGMGGVAVALEPFRGAINPAVAVGLTVYGNGAPPTTTETIRMKEWSLGIAYSRPY